MVEFLYARTETPKISTAILIWLISVVSLAGLIGTPKLHTKMQTSDF
jgi:hypothetical protein